MHIECVQDKLEDQEKLLKKHAKEKEKEQGETDLELNRYKDLLSLREKEISSMKKELDMVRQKNQTNVKRVEDLEKEKQELNGALRKQSRGISPFKV